MPKSIVDAIVREGKVYAVPVNIHGQNWLFYNTKIFADAGLEPPKTFGEIDLDRRETEGQGCHSTGFGRPADLGTQPVPRRARRHGGADLFRKSTAAT